MKLQQDTNASPSHRKLASQWPRVEAESESFRDVSVARFVSFLHLLVLFPMPIPGSIPAEFY